jgi:ribonuclease P protein component
MARFTKSQRLLTSSEFDQVLDSPGTKVTCPDFVLVASRKNDQRSSSRLGLIVSGKVGNAVTRNKIKRSIRSVFRENLSLSQELAGRDLVVIARPAIVMKSGRLKDNIQDRFRLCSDRLVKQFASKSMTHNQGTETH